MIEPFVIAQRDDIRCCLQPDKANRHGLITRATGTGETITLQTLAEAFSGAPPSPLRSRQSVMRVCPHSA